ncbi:hypothetical protein N657DRAFT_644008 [Parathielavia appendiculata]|uniref:BHLH domain-containing protein n=1 Tax=Parathielavia appendiculata TaxID=2587402 RepID=A0AAN6U2C2_9PEZI|nr:hypothetical protein N657DRAFT_644008 [Parathielavia appendiculata]
MIEKRYRTNLNDKITQLRDAVPSLRLLAQRAKNAAEGGSATRAELEDDDDDAAAVAEDGGLIRETTCSTSGLKLNKATILSKATEYIRQLERRNQGLEAENGALRGRMEGLEMILMSHGGVLGGWN